MGLDQARDLECHAHLRRVPPRYRGLFLATCSEACAHSELWASCGKVYISGPCWLQDDSGAIPLHYGERLAFM